MTIRPYRAEDLPVIMEIANRAWRPIHAAYRAEYGDALFAMLFPTPETRVGENVLYARVLTGLDDGHAPARRAYERAGFHIGHGTVTLYTKL